MLFGTETWWWQHTRFHSFQRLPVPCVSLSVVLSCLYRFVCSLGLVGGDMIELWKHLASVSQQQNGGGIEDNHKLNGTSSAVFDSSLASMYGLDSPSPYPFLPGKTRPASVHERSTWFRSTLLISIPPGHQFIEISRISTSSTQLFSSCMYICSCSCFQICA